MHTTMKSYDLLTGVNGRATFMISKTCLPYLIDSAEKGRNPHILNNAPVRGKINIGAGCVNWNL